MAKESKQVASRFSFGTTGNNCNCNIVNANLTHAFQAIFFAPLLWAMAVTFIRASILSLYYNIFITSRFHIFCHVVQAINAAFGAAIILGKCLICRPMAMKWNYNIRGHCGDQTLLDLLIAVLNMILDFSIVVLPMPVLWGLQMSLGKKFALSCIFGLGFLYGPSTTPGVFSKRLC